MQKNSNRLEMVPQSPPTFFKVLIDASAPQLPLPPDFVTFHLKNKIPNDPIIQCANGGYSWKLKIEKVGEYYCFTHAWNNVVEDIKLGYGDFLVFSQIDESTFNVLIFSPNGCEKDLPPKIKVEHDGSGANNDVVDIDDVDDDDDGSDDDDDGSGDGDDDDDDGSGDGEDVDGDGSDDDGSGDGEDVDGDGDDEDVDDPFFMPTMTKTNGSVLRLTAEFERLAGINAEGSIKIKNLDGEEFPVVMRSYKSSPTTKRYYLSTGWLDFRRINNLSDGDKCILKFLKSEGKLCLAKILKPPPCGKFSTTVVVKGKRGRSPQREHNDRMDVDVESEDECVKVIKRPRGRPPKQQQGLSPQQ